MSKFDATNQDAINRDNRAMQALGLTHSMVEILDDLYALILAGSIGITATAADVDSLALGGGACTQDTGTTSGLTFGYKAGRFHNGLSNVTISAGTILLSASNTNYIEVDRSGTVSKNTSGFTSGWLPLWTIVTGVSGITTITMSKPLLTLIGTAGVVGAMLSTAGATKELHLSLGDIAATAAVTIILPNIAGTINKISYCSKTTLAADDINYYKFKVINKGAAGTGTTVLADDTAAANSTKATGGSGITAYVPRHLTLTSTGADLIHAASDVLELTITKVGAPATQAQAAAKVDSAFSG